MLKPTTRIRAGVLLTGALALLLSGCASGPGTSDSSAPSSNPASTTVTSSTITSSAAEPNAKPVSVTSLEGDGQTYGIGMPIILRFSPTPTDSSAFVAAAKVSVNGTQVNGAWFWSQPYKDQPIEAHFRMQSFWPAHATVKVELPVNGLSAGKGLKFSTKLTSITWQTGDAHVTTVSNQGTHAQMVVTSNGAQVKVLPVSLGAAKTPTYNGTKIVMQKGEDVPGSNPPTLRPDGAVRMIGPGYDEMVDWSVRMTASGEYIHAAPWNTRLGQLNTSNGCTNLTTNDAKWFYSFALVGDVVRYFGTDGTLMPSWDGLGDWNLPWGLWQQGGLLNN